MERWFIKTQSHPDAWQVPLEKTRYPREVPAFWELLGEARDILSVVKDRGYGIFTKNQNTIQVARNELRWAVEEEAYDVGKVNRTIHDMLKALRVSEEPKERALIKAYGMGEATENLD